MSNESPALSGWAPEYPGVWGPKVPLKVIMLETVTSDLPLFFPQESDLICIKGNEYFVWVNKYGAISANLDNGERLGLKPKEFEIIEYHS